MNNQPVIVEEYRGGSLENTHQGVIVVINDKQEVLYEKGDITHSVFYRSAMKPIQAIPAFSTDIIEKYGLTQEEAALFTASQRGEAYQEKALLRLMEKLDIQEDLLVCQASLPLNDEPKKAYVWEHKQERKLMHNCAGKHLGLLAYAREKGYDLKSYHDIDHPLQQEILQHVSELSVTPKADIKIGVDGCGVPVFSIPLKNMAVSYLKFAAPDLIADEKTQTAVKKIGKAMHAHPEIVASHDFICTALLEDPNIIAKGGAQGVYCLSLIKERISIALKVLSGSELVWPVLVAEILRKLNYDNEATMERLLAIRSKAILNDSGKPIGETKVLL
ncbi:asparaginase [Ornithinibacillus gellani]|uniref:asparaginase n=1 Tax=Ornithinibacillus gellani TaxID=2293253 RepID=UPI000F45EFDC|nr:asparaginase [Ornithinibacillus gellani]TQS71251.1 asparaginase [Ornithinibacillus gellani]